MIYTSIIHQDFPINLLEDLGSIAETFESRGYIVRTNEDGNGHNQILEVCKRVEIIQFDYIPNWLDEYAKHSFVRGTRDLYLSMSISEKIKLANYCALIIGEDGKCFPDFVVTWYREKTIHTQELGYLGHALRLARFFKIPTYNLCDKKIDLDY